MSLKNKRDKSMEYIHIIQYHARVGGGVGCVITDISEEMVKQGANVYVYLVASVAEQ